MSDTQEFRNSKPPQPPEGWTLREADDAVRALREALSQVGVKFPSLHAEHGRLDSPMVELGRVRPDVAQKLADVLKGATPHG